MHKETIIPLTLGNRKIKLQEMYEIEKKKWHQIIMFHHLMIFIIFRAINPMISYNEEEDTIVFLQTLFPCSLSHWLSRVSFNDFGYYYSSVSCFKE